MRLRRARGRRGQNRARRGHAVQQRENLQLRLQFIGDAIDRQIDLADGVLDGRDKGHVGQSFRADLLAQGFAGMMQVAGLGITSFSSTRQPARTAFRASTRQIGSKLEAACATARIEKPDSCRSASPAIVRRP